MNVAVVYKSKVGSTKRYAQWIAEETGADIFELGEFKKKKTINYNTIIFGGGLYAVGINGISFIKKNLDKFEDKNLIIFAVGASPKREEVVQDILNNNFTNREKEKFKFFYFRGGFDMSKLGFFNKMLIKKLKEKIKKKEDPTPDEKGMLKATRKPVNFKKKSNIEELLIYIKKERLIE